MEVDCDSIMLTEFEKHWQKFNKVEFGWLSQTYVVKVSQNMIKGDRSWLKFMGVYVRLNDVYSEWQMLTKVD